MTSTFQRIMSAAVLAVWGAVLLTIYFTGRIGAYLHPHFRPFELAAGIILIVFAVLLVFAPQTAGSHGSPSRSRVRKILLSLILVGPLLLAFYNSTDSMDATAVSNRNYVQDISQIPSVQVQSSAGPSPTASAMPTATPAAEPSPEDNFSMPKSATGQVRAQLIDFLYAVQLPEVRSQLENKPVEVIGQLMPAKGQNPKGDKYVIIRMVISCCAADAQPVALPIELHQKPKLPDMTWVKVSGTAAFPIEGGRRVPIVREASIEQIPAPEDPYIY